LAYCDLNLLDGYSETAGIGAHFFAAGAIGGDVMRLKWILVFVVACLGLLAIFSAGETSGQVLNQENCKLIISGNHFKVYDCKIDHRCFLAAIDTRSLVYSVDIEICGCVSGDGEMP
jgi:hypothetical protein